MSYTVCYFFSNSHNVFQQQFATHTCTPPTQILQQMFLVLIVLLKNVELKKLENSWKPILKRKICTVDTSCNALHCHSPAEYSYCSKEQSNSLLAPCHTDEVWTRVQNRSPYKLLGNVKAKIVICGDTY